MLVPSLRCVLAVPILSTAPESTLGGPCEQGKPDGGI
jgi:hypothetical protein